MEVLTENEENESKDAILGKTVAVIYEQTAILGGWNWDTPLAAMLVSSGDRGNLIWRCGLKGGTRVERDHLESMTND